MTDINSDSTESLGFNETDNNTETSKGMFSTKFWIILAIIIVILVIVIIVIIYFVNKDKKSSPMSTPMSTSISTPMSTPAPVIRQETIIREESPIGIKEKLNCEYSDWGVWSQCINNSQQRTRTVTYNPSNKECTLVQETKECTSPIDCMEGPWGDWSSCIGGVKTRIRTIITQPQFGGRICGALQETDKCFDSSTMKNYIYSGNVVENFAASSAGFGYVSALSYDGKTLVVGDPTDNESRGALFVYLKTDNGWIQQAKLVGSEAVPSAQIGSGLAISNDGNTVVTSGYQYLVPNTSNRGGVWVFKRDGTTWTQDGPVITTPHTNQLSTVIAISGDGKTIAFGSNDAVSVVVIYVNQNNKWIEQQNIKQSSYDSTYGWFGWGRDSIALSNDGNLMVLGASLARGNKTSTNIYGDQDWGSVIIFTRNNNNWTQSQILVPDNLLGPSNFGSIVKLSKDGTTLAISGPRDKNNIGAVWIYNRSGSTWNYQAKLIGTPNNVELRQGNTLDLSSDGNILIVGSPSKDNSTGVVWIWRRINNTWTENTSTLVRPNSDAKMFGFYVSLSADASTLAVTSYMNMINGVQMSKVYIYSGSE